MSRGSKKTAATPRRRGRKFLLALLLLGAGTAVARKKAAGTAPAADPAPAPPAPPPPAPVIPTSPVEPVVETVPEPAAEVAAEPEPEPEDEDAIERLETEAPAVPADSLTSFFDDVLTESEENKRQH